MTLTSDKKLELHAWGISAAVHGLIVCLAVIFMAQIHPLPLNDVFQWEVSLVQPMMQEAKVEQSEPVRPAPAPTPRVQPIQPVESVPQVVTRQVRTTDTPMVVQRDTPKVVETTEPIEPTVSVQQRQEITPETQLTRQVQVEARPVEQVVQELKKQEPVVAETAQPIDHVAAATPVYEEQMIQTKAVAALSHDAIPQPSTTAVVDVPKGFEQAPAAAVAPSPNSVIAEPAVEVAKAAPQTSDVRADHRWVGESLWRRVAELKRYPSSARLNGLEGRVILKAVIRADGHLAEVVVVKSSGHAVLDAAAVEAVKMACPLHMKHPIGPPQIVVSLPIVYSLAN